MHKHSHTHSCGKSSKNIKIAFVLNLVFTIAEIIGGFLTNSVAIMADALHDLGDTFALGVAWHFSKISEKRGTKKFTYGYQRFSMLSAIISGLILLVGSLFILSEVVQRIITPEPSSATGMILFAIVGVAVNGLAVIKLSSGKTMNERIVTWHLLEDVLGWVAVLIVGIVLLFWDFKFLDPLLSALITLFILWNVFKNLKKTINLFLQGVPDEISAPVVEEKIVASAGVQAVHDTHIWSLDGEQHILTAHIVIDDGLSQDEIIELKNVIKKMLFSIDIQHATLEFEFASEECETNCN